MPQGRIVLKQICQSRKLADLKTDGARLLYTWLIPNVDVNGCFSGDPHVIKGQVFTRLRKSVKTIQSYLDNLYEVGLVILYEANGDSFLNIPDFADRQPNINPNKEAKPTIPPPTPDQLQTYSRPTPPQVKERKVKESKEKVKTRFLDFVFLTEKEYSKLKGKFGKIDADEKIAALNEGIGSKGYKYNSHYFTILSWARKNEKDNPPEQQPACIVDRKPGHKWQNNQKGEKVWLCTECFEAINKLETRGGNWGKLTSTQIENKVLAAKAKDRGKDG